MGDVRRPSLARWYIVLFILLLLQVHSTLTANFHGDELGWLESSRQAFQAVRHGDLDAPIWHGYLDTFGDSHPWFGRLAVGAVISLSGYGDIPVPMNYDWTLSREENLRRGVVPPPGLLLPARALIAASGLLACLFLAAIGTMLLSEEAGLAAALLLASNPSFHRLTGQVMMDVLALSLGLGGIAAALAIGRRINRDAPYGLLAVFAGMLLGAALAVKLNAALQVMAAFVMLGIQFLFSHRSRLRAWLWSMLVTAATCGATFFLANPPLYRDAARTFDGWLQFNALVHSSNLDKSYYLATPSDRLAALLDGRQLPQVWPEPIFLLGPLAYLLLLGLACLLIYRHSRRSASILGIWLAIGVLGLAAWMPVPFARYKLPLIPCLVLLETTVLFALVTSLRDDRRRRIAGATLAVLAALLLAGAYIDLVESQPLWVSILRVLFVLGSLYVAFDFIQPQSSSSRPFTIKQWLRRLEIGR